MNRSKKDIIHSTLKRQILNLKIKPNQVLKEEEIAQAHGVSRTPAREALQLLEQEGFLEQKRKIGYLVRALSREDLKEIIEVRSILEGYAARLATTRKDSRTIEQLKEINEKAVHLLDVGELEKFFRNSSDFHDVLYRGSGNQRLCGIIESLRDNFLRYRRMLLRIPSMPQIQIEDHSQMLTMMEKGREDAVERLVRKHIRRGGKALLEYLDRDHIEILT
ncbi:MAG: GntR family transcriptional regulator [Pseudomonadota bacterium]|nr:GntR family transcriptional regulator [Pseudomonadota bacterium]